MKISPLGSKKYPQILWVWFWCWTPALPLFLIYLSIVVERHSVEKHHLHSWSSKFLLSWECRKIHWSRPSKSKPRLLEECAVNRRSRDTKLWILAIHWMDESLWLNKQLISVNERCSTHTVGIHRFSFVALAVKLESEIGVISIRSQSNHLCQRCFYRKLIERAESLSGNMNLKWS